MDPAPTPRDLVGEANEAASDPDRQDEIHPLLDEAAKQPTHDWSAVLANANQAIERLQAVDLQPGDIVIGTLPPGATNELAEAVGHDLAHRFPDNPTMILPPGVGIHTVRWSGPVQVDQLAGDFVRSSLPVRHVGPGACSMNLPPGWRFDPFGRPAAPEGVADGAPPPAQETPT